MELSDAQRCSLVVHIGWEGDPSTCKDVPRYQLTPASLNSLFACDVEFLQSSVDGACLFPEAWATRCSPPPAVYFLRERSWPTLEPDALEEGEYRGGVVVLAVGVPPQAGREGLAAWLAAGLRDDDGGSPADAPMVLGANRERPVLLGAQLLKPTLGAAGIVMQSGQKAPTLAVELSLVERTPPPALLGTWEVRFPRTPAGERLAYLAVHKYNWRDFRLATDVAAAGGEGEGEAGGEEGAGGRVAPLAAAASAWPPPPGPSLPLQEVVMRGVVLTRVRHGRGLTRFADARGFYSGQWCRGERHGQGTEINAGGRFQGSFEHGWRRGPGTAIGARGDEFKGAYAASGPPRGRTGPSLLDGDEYADGLASGMGRIAYPDGSVFEGSWREGRPSGRGRYARADGLLLEGEFGPWGLHGPGTEAGHGRTRLGVWHDGHLRGTATELFAEGGMFEGAFQYGIRAGHGEEQIGEALLSQGRFQGAWRLGQRDAHGVLSYGERTTPEPRGTGLLTLGGAPSAPGEWAHEAPGGASHSLPPDDSDSDGGSITPPPPQPRDHLIPYRGDFQVETQWLGGLPRGGGVLTRRRGEVSEQRHAHAQVQEGSNASLAALGGGGVAQLVAVERALSEKRAAAARGAHAALLLAREAKEGENLAAFASWTAAAHITFEQEVMRRTRRARRAVELAREELTGVAAPPPASLPMAPKAAREEARSLIAQEAWASG